MKASHYLFMSVLVLSGSAGGVFAQTDVESKVQRLEETVLRLENRLADLEAQQRGPRASAPPAGKLGWRQLKMGMSEAEVEKLLGSPTRVDAIGSSKTWHYLDRGIGLVDFRDGAVRRWSEP